MAINTINIGSTANDGTGDPVRSAFETVNDNFAFIQGGLFAGSEISTITASSLNGQYIVSNTYIYATTYANANTIVARGNIISGSNLFVQSNGAYIIGNVRIIGNLEVTGDQSASQSQAVLDPIIALHYSAVPLSSDDSRDIGLEWQYYKGSQQRAFLGWQNSTSSLIYYDNTTQSAGNVITAGTPGNVQFGQLLLSNTTSSTSNVTGALIVSGGAGVAGNVYVQSNVFVGNSANVGNLTVRGNVSGRMYFDGGADTIYVAGSPVVTSATAFAGGPVPAPTQFTDTTTSVSTSSGAVTIAGGLGVAGNVFLPNLTITTGGNVRANVIGNIFTNSQPYITSVGSLTSLQMAGPINAHNINPGTNLTYSLGSGTSNRWTKIWTFDLDLSGTLTGGAVNSTGGDHSGVISITTNAQATSTSTGALKVAGGVSISSGNLYISGSGGNAIVATSEIWASTLNGTTVKGVGNAQAVSNSTGDLQVAGGASINTGNLYIGGSGGNAIVAVGDIYNQGNINIGGSGGNAIVAAGDIYNQGNIWVTGSTNTGVKTNQSTAYVFNETATIVKIAGAGVAKFDNNTQATSNSTGAIQLTGGMSINTGNLYIGGSSGNALISTGDIYNQGNIWVTGSTNTGVKTNQSTAYVFNETATIVKIAGAGVAKFDNNTQATSSSTGAVQLTGGMSINTGNLYIGGSGGRSITAAGNTVVTGSTSISPSTGALVVQGGTGISGNLYVAGNVFQQSAYYETFGNVTNSGGNLVCDFNLGAIFNVTSLSRNVTASFTNVNSVVGTVTGATLLINQGATAYTISNIQINGQQHSVRWSGALPGGASPIGLANNTDVISYSMLCIGNNAYRILAQLSSFG